MSIFKSMKAQSWRRPEVLLYLMAASVPISFITWTDLINNFAVERAAFTGREMGILQSIREVPGFLAFAVVFLLLLVREQRLAYLSLFLLGLGTAVTGFFPSVLGLYVTTFLMSLGFHYYETLQQSLSLQWIDKRRAPETLGRIISVGSFAAVVSLGLIWLALSFAGLEFRWIYLLAGGLTATVAVFCWVSFPTYEEAVVQHKKMVLRKRYWLFYALTFMSGARRQIFIVFAGFLLVEKFGYGAEQITLLFLLNATMNIWLAPRIGRLVARIGERSALVCEYIGLIGIFVSYAFVENAIFAGGLYVADHIFFAMAIAIKTYFQKIADPKDIAASAGVGFTINHIAAVVIPAVFGLIWLVSPAAVFLAGAAMAAASLLLSCNVPHKPEPGNEVLVGRVAGPLQAAE